MKKIIIAALLLLTLSGCKKELGCGVVVGGDIEFGMYRNYYYLNVKFGNRVKKVYVDHKTYSSYYSGSSICF